METAILILVFVFIIYQFFTILGLKDDKETLKAENKILEEKMNIYYSLWRKAVEEATKK